MSTNVIQNSFAAGELSPALYARTDLGKYHVGAALVENFVVDFKGGVFNRNGTKFIQRCKGGGDGTVRLIDFQFSTVQTYILEFGHEYIRFYAQGAPVLESTKAITGITQANPGVVTSASHGYLNGDWLVLNDILGMTELNGRTVIVAGSTTNTFQLTDLDGNNIDTSQFNAYLSSGTAARVYTLSSPYSSSDLSLLKYTQSADVMTIAHPSYSSYDLNRLGNANWTLTAINPGTSAVAPTSPVVTPSTSGSAMYAYAITTVDAEGNESLPVVQSNSACVDIASTEGTIKISWTAAAGADHYRVYKAPSSANASTNPIDVNSVNYGWIADAFGTSTIDDNITPDFTITPPLHKNPFASSNYPGAVAYFQQRRVYGGSTSGPETLWMSQPGNFDNFDASLPVKDDDAITVTLASKQVNNIKYMVGMPGGLIVLTGSSAWQISGGANSSAITPASLVATPQAYTGTADLPPIVINYDILFVQARGNVVRDLAYNFYVNIYTGIDISLLSNHLLIGYQLKEWAYCEEPNKVVWSVRDDGKMLSLTYLKEQEVYGWAQHHTTGLFKSVASIQEGSENILYCAVERYVKGEFVKYVERMSSRLMPYGVEDSWFLDCALMTELPTPAATITASAASGNGVSFTVDSSVFTPEDVGLVIRMGGGIATITQYVSNVEVIGNITREIQDTLYGDTSVSSVLVPLPQTAGNWSLAAPVSTVSGLDHLEGQTVGVFVDGSVQNDKVVTFGSIVLDEPGTKILVGLRYSSRLQTLRLDAGEPTIQGKRKKISALTVRVQDTRGLKMGMTWDTLREYKMRSTQPMGLPIDLETGDQRIIMDPSWTAEGQICIRQDYPLPATVLGVIPEIAVGDSPSK